MDMVVHFDSEYGIPADLIRCPSYGVLHLLLLGVGMLKSMPVAWHMITVPDHCRGSLPTGAIHHTHLLSLKPPAACLLASRQSAQNMYRSASTAVRH